MAYKKQTATQEYSIMLVEFKLKYGWFRLNSISWSELPSHLKSNYSQEIIIQIYV